jgi:hypothetical protein
MLLRAQLTRGHRAEGSELDIGSPRVNRIHNAIKWHHLVRTHESNILDLHLGLADLANNGAEDAGPEL